MSVRFYSWCSIVLNAFKVHFSITYNVKHLQTRYKVTNERTRVTDLPEQVGSAGVKLQTPSAWQVILSLPDVILYPTLQLKATIEL